MKTMKSAVAVTVATLILAVAMLVTGCGGDRTASPDQSISTSSTINKTDPSSPQNSTIPTDAVTSSEGGTKSGASSENATEAKSSNGTSSKSDDDKTSDSDKSSGGSASSKSSGGSDSGSSTSGKTSGGGSGSGKSSDSDSSGGSVDPHAGKTYHEAVYENVYVVDQKAYSYEEPVYEKRAYTVCHVCGAEFDTTDGMGAFWAHDDEHLLSGEGSGYHSYMKTIQTGTNTVNVPEEGHYEKKLVREAGWY